MKRRVIIVAVALLVAFLCACSAPQEEETASEIPYEPDQSESTEESVPEPTQRDVVHDADTRIVFSEDGKVEINGAGASSAGGVAAITGGGTYTVSGKAPTGAVAIDSPGETVNLVLNNADLSGGTRPGIQILNAGSMRITLADGTYNNVRGGNAEYPSALYCAVPLTISGSGSLFAYANVMNGITCTADLTIESGSVSASATGTGIAAEADEQTMLTILGGELYSSGDQCGLRSSGRVRIAGGSILAFGGVYSSEGGVTGQLGYTVEGGTVCATGGTQERPADASQPYLFFEFEQIPPSAAASITAGSEALMHVEVPRAFDCLVYSSPALSLDTEYSLAVKGQQIATGPLFSPEESPQPSLELEEAPEVPTDGQ